MQLKCKCSNFELAVQVRTTGGILSLDFYCGRCHALKEKKPPFKFSKDEPMFREPEQPEDRFIRDELVADRDFYGDKQELNAEEQCIAAGAKTSLEGEDESLELPVIELEVTEPSSTTRGDWQLYGSESKSKPKRDLTALVYAEEVEAIGKFFNLSKTHLDKAFQAAYFSILNWTKGAKPRERFRARIDYVSGIMYELIEMYGDIEFRRNDKELRDLLGANKINKTLVKAQSL